MECKRVVWSLLALVAVAPAARGEEAWRPELLAEAEEVAAALAAGPSTIRGGAGVYVLRATGFERVRPSTNGFHCLVERSQPGAFEPQCLDAEGSRTLLREMLLKAELRQRGASAAAVEQAVGRAWDRGELAAPSRPGINYMLSERNRVPIDPETVIPYRPHVMFYAPYLTNADLGAEPAGEAPVFVINEGRPGAYVIVPVPAADGEAHGGG